MSKQIIEEIKKRIALIEKEIMPLRKLEVELNTLHDILGVMNGTKVVRDFNSCDGDL